MTTSTAIHPFTRAGMGEAPFRLTAEDAAHRALRLGGGFAFCDACGIAISRVYHVKSACGKVSTVGCNCVEKIANEDPELAREVDDVKRKEDRKARVVKKAAKEASVHETLLRLNDEPVREALASKPHPKGRPGSNLLDWAVWMANNAGLKGRTEVAKVIEQLP